MSSLRKSTKTQPINPESARETARYQLSEEAKTVKDKIQKTALQVFFPSETKEAIDSFLGRIRTNHTPNKLDALHIKNNISAQIKLLATLTEQLEYDKFHSKTNLQTPSPYLSTNEVIKKIYASRCIDFNAATLSFITQNEILLKTLYEMLLSGEIQVTPNILRAIYNPNPLHFHLSLAEIDFLAQNGNIPNDLIPYYENLSSLSHEHETYQNQLSQYFDLNPTLFSPSKNHSSKIAKLLKLHSTKGKSNDTFLDPALDFLQQNFPIYYNILLENLPILTKSLFLRIYGRKSIKIHSGKKQVIVFPSQKIGQGSFGIVHEVQYCDSQTLTLTPPNFAVIKLPHPHSEATFAQEVKDAETISKMENPYISKPLFIGNMIDKYIIYSTGLNPRGLSSLLKINKNKTFILLLTQLLDFIKIQSQVGFFHGDLKEGDEKGNGSNILVVNDVEKNNVERLLVIDNSPNTKDKINHGWIRTKGYYPDISILNTFAKDPDKYLPCIDLFAFGTILSNLVNLSNQNTFIQKNRQAILNIADQCKNPNYSSQPNFIDNIISELQNLKP